MSEPNERAVVEASGFHPYLLRFLEWSRVSGCSEDTVRRRWHALRRFIVWCDARDLRRPQEITKPILERYQRYLYYYRKEDGRPLGFGSQLVMLTPIKSFFKWLARGNHILYNPASELELPRRPKRLPRALLSIDEIERILEQPDLDTPEGVRDRALLEVLYATGIRRLEVVGLCVHDIDATRGTLRVTEGKGRRDRYVPIGERALGWVLHYHNEARAAFLAGRDDGTLFLTRFGAAFSRGGLAQIVKKHIRASGLDITGSCHLFRHAMATHMLENGADVRFIQMMLGHSDLNSTQIYTQVALNKLRDIHTATHPINRRDDED